MLSQRLQISGCFCLRTLPFRQRMPKTCISTTSVMLVSLYCKAEYSSSQKTPHKHHACRADTCFEHALCCSFADVAISCQCLTLPVYSNLPPMQINCFNIATTVRLLQSLHGLCQAHHHHGVLVMLGGAVCMQNCISSEGVPGGV